MAEMLSGLSNNLFNIINTENGVSSKSQDSDFDIAAFLDELSQSDNANSSEGENSFFIDELKRQIGKKLPENADEVNAIMMLAQTLISHSNDQLVSSVDTDELQKSFDLLSTLANDKKASVSEMVSQSIDQNLNSDISSNSQSSIDELLVDDSVFSDSVNKLNEVGRQLENLVEQNGETHQNDEFEMLVPHDQGTNNRILENPPIDQADSLTIQNSETINSNTSEQIITTDDQITDQVLEKSNIASDILVSGANVPNEPSKTGVPSQNNSDTDTIEVSQIDKKFSASLSVDTSTSSSLVIEQSITASNLRAGIKRLENFDIHFSKDRVLQTDSASNSVTNDSASLLSDDTFDIVQISNSGSNTEKLTAINIVRQITSNLSNALESSTKEITIALDPPELGKVNIKIIESKEGELSAVLEVEKVDVKNEIQKEIPQLLNIIHDSGAKVSKIEVIMNDVNSAGDFNMNYSENDDQQTHEGSDGHSAGFSDNDTGFTNMNPEPLTVNTKITDTSINVYM